MKILSIIPDTIVDGPRLRSSVYLSGCWHKCPGCHNPESWNPGGGSDMTLEEVVGKLISYGHRRVTLSGGDPLCHQRKETLELCRKLKEKGFDIWLYTGYTLEEIKEEKDKDAEEILKLVDGIVDGPFIEEKKSEAWLFRGSTNQRIWLRNESGELYLSNIYNL